MAERSSFEQQEHDFYAALGRSLNAWTKVEDGLFHVFAAALDSPNDSVAASAVFYAVISSPTRLEMTDAALRIRTDSQALLEEWVALRAKYRRHTRSRVPLAHYHLVTVVGKAHEDNVFLAPSFFSQDYGTADRVTVRAIVGRTKGFETLASELRGFSDRVHASPRLTEEHFRSRPYRILPKSLQRQQRQTLARQRRSSQR
jgi:hypothetical protein